MTADICCHILSDVYQRSIANIVLQPKYYYHAKFGAFTPECTIFSPYGLTSRKILKKNFLLLVITGLRVITKGEIHANAPKR